MDITGARLWLALVRDTVSGRHAWADPWAQSIADAGSAGIIISILQQRSTASCKPAAGVL